MESYLTNNVSDTTVTIPGCILSQRQDKPTTGCGTVICIQEAVALRVLNITPDRMSKEVDKSPGPDGIHPRLLGEARQEIAGALTKIFVSSLASGAVPGD
eukprot:g25685.t1